MFYILVQIISSRWEHCIRLDTLEICIAGRVGLNLNNQTCCSHWLCISAVHCLSPEGTKEQINVSFNPRSAYLN